MKREQFLKSLGIGLGVAVVAPQLLTAKNPIPKGEEPKLAIDILSVSNLSIGGHRLTSAEIMDIYHQTGFLIYQSQDGKGRRYNAPIVINGSVEVIDVAKIKG